MIEQNTIKPSAFATAGNLPAFYLSLTILPLSNVILNFLHLTFPLFKRILIYKIVGLPIQQLIRYQRILILLLPGTQQIHQYQFIANFLKLKLAYLRHQSIIVIH